MQLQPASGALDDFLDLCDACMVEAFTSVAAVLRSNVCKRVGDTR